MRTRHLVHLACPECQGSLTVGKADDASDEEIREGELACSECDARFPVVRSIPRFVNPENYASSFGLQWLEHARTQYDSESGVHLSAHRFFEEACWPRDMQGKVIIEAGCGSGRFTEQAASTGAQVLAFDYSAAVEANYAAHCNLPNVLIVQGDIYRMPFRRAAADALFCFGVIQHTPDPRNAFLALPGYLKPGGRLVADVYLQKYPIWLSPKYLLRPFTRRIPPARLYRYVRRYIDFLWPLAGLIRRIPRIGASLNWRLLVADYSNVGVPGPKLKEWAYLNTFDMMAPRYDFPQTLDEVQRWYDEANLERGSVYYGLNGIAIVGHAPVT